LWLDPGPANLSQNGQKPTPLLTSLTKYLKPKTPKIFVRCSLEDLRCLLRVWTAL